MLRTNGLKSIALALVGAVFMGCSHRFEIKNLSEYKSDTLVQRFNKPVTMGIIFREDDDNNLRRYVKEIGSELQKYTTEVIYPYNPNGLKKANVEARISITPEYKGSVANFFINWPGFLVWAPAWNGYVYKVNYEVEVILVDVASNKKIDQFSLPINLDIRHAAINRTWTEISWFEVSAIAFIGGLAFTQYSPGVTPLVVNDAARTIGSYVAEEIVNHLNSSGLYSQILRNEITEWRASR